MIQAHRENFTVRNYQVGPHQAIHVRTLLDYLQETADAHIRSLGVSVQDLLDKGLLWVLAAYRLEIHRFPRAGETVNVSTWYPGRMERFYLRDFEAHCGGRKPVAAATTSWALIDDATRRPVEAGSSLPDLPVLEKRALVGGFEKLPPLDSPDAGKPFTVGAGCLDMYNHVNHVFTIQWALDSVRPGIEKGVLPVSIEAVFKAEAVAGDRLIAAVQPAGEKSQWLHSITRKGDGREIIRMRSRWKEA